MKTLTAILVAAALVAPTTAFAQRHTTPGQAERHASAQAKAEGETANSEVHQTAKNDRANAASHIRAAKAGRINIAKAQSDGRS